MPSVLLAGLSPSDPAGSRAVRDAVRHALPNHHVRDLSAIASTRLWAAARQSAGVVVAGAALGPRLHPGPALALLAGTVRRPLSFVGVSAPPLDAALAGAAARWALAGASLLLPADDRSVAHLAQAGVPTPMRVTADPAWLALAGDGAQDPAAVAPPAYAGHPDGRDGADHPSRHRPRGESVVVVVDGRVAAPVDLALLRALITVARTGRRVRLLPWAGSHSGLRPGHTRPSSSSPSITGPGDILSPDQTLAAKLARAVDGVVPGGAAEEPAPLSLSEAAALMADAHAVVAMRHRALHAAAAAGVPAVAVAVTTATGTADPRLTALARRLDQPVLEAEDLVTALPVTLERLAPASAAVPEVVAEEMARARAGLRLLRLVLEPDAVPPAAVENLPLVPVPWL